MAQLGRNFLKNEVGAIAPLYALSLTALIAVGGIAFDYSRMASMDTELQNAADQAALAAASQLDGTEDATMRAENAANQMVANQTRFSNDGNASGRDVAIAEVTFYSCATNACRDDPVGANMTVVDRDDDSVDDDDAARYVGVRVANRRSFYALTPIVNAVSSGDMAAGALAGMGSAICRVPPVMMCNPNEGGDPDFTTANYIGVGIRLVANDGGGGYGPGNFGFLANDAGNGAAVLRQALGRPSPPGNCIRYDGVTTEPGAMVSVLDALNTRFNVYANGLNATCNNDNSLCPGSANTRKDVRMGGAGNSLAYQPGNGNTGWKLPDNANIGTQLYPPAALTTQRALNNGEINQLWPMGHPRDICHAASSTGICAGGRIGNGVWDRNAYFRSNSPTNYPASGVTNADMTNWFGTTTPTRYQVYRWEIDNAASRLQPYTSGGSGANGRTSYGQPIGGGGLVPGDDVVDRRRLSVAVINCGAEGVSGRTVNVHVTKWIEVFLVEPTIPRPRTENSDLYVEVIEETNAGGGQTAGQVVRRDVPRLIE
jgi:Putative Flp pilus-assembly TadE/G-like